MKSKSWSISFEMILRKNYCSECGTMLEKEKTHRVVTSEDIDYYQYHDYRTFPKNDCDVYDYQFACPSCGKRFSNVNQRIIRRIQKSMGKILLSPSEIKEKYKNAEESDRRYSLCRSILFPAVFNFLFFAHFLFFGNESVQEKWYILLVLFVLTTVYTTVMAIRGHKGRSVLKRHRKYSYENEEQLKRLYTYSFSNKDLVEKSDKCYCYFCMKELNREQITGFAADEKTAVCPNCGKTTVLPDSIEEKIDNNTVDQMNKYWF